MNDRALSYVAFLRGIGPENPNTRNEKLRKVFEDIGFADVRTFISSGNVIFTANSKNTVLLERKIEKALADRLGFNNPVIIRSGDDIKRLVQKDPFGGKAHSGKSYLIVTFLKKEPWEVFSVVDLTRSKTPNVMARLEKKYGKTITTRTWQTVTRISKRLEE